MNLRLHVLGILIALFLAVGLFFASIWIITPQTFAANQCDSASYYRQHYGMCDNAYPNYTFYYWWWHSTYKSYVNDDPVHPQYHPKGYYDSATYYHSEYYKSGASLQGDGVTAEKETGGHTKYHGETSSNEEIRTTNSSETTHENNTTSTHENPPEKSRPHSTKH